jgi:hypothetical protein
MNAIKAKARGEPIKADLSTCTGFKAVITTSSCCASIGHAHKCNAILHMKNLRINSIIV